MLTAVTTAAGELAGQALRAARSAWVSTTTAAKRLGYTSEALRRACATKRIPGAQPTGPGGHWRIPRTWLDEQLRRTAPVKRTR